MDKLTVYRDVIKSLLGQLVEVAGRGGAPGIETLCALDDERGQYIVVNTGWIGDRRVRGTTLHLRLLNGKVWIEEDWTEDGIATELVQSGVPREDIVLAFHPAQDRQYTEFASV